MARSERYAYEKEIREVLCQDGSGQVLGVDPKTGKPLVLDKEGNTLFIGLPGVGKTRCGTVPLSITCLNAGEILISADSKKELLNATYSIAKKNGYDVIVFDFRDIEHSTGYNILRYPYELYKTGTDSNVQLALEMVDIISSSIFKFTPGSKEEPFWIDSARSLFEASVEILFKYAQSEDEVTLLNVYRIISEGTERLGARKVFDYICDLNPTESLSYMLKNVCTAPNDTLNSILSSTYQPLNSFIKNPGLMKMITSDEFKISTLEGHKKVAIYICTPDETDSYASISGILISQIMSHYIKLAHDKYSGRLPRRVNVCIEELGNIGASITNLPTLMSAGRSRNIRTSIVLQSYSQLDDIYGSSRATTITSNVDTIVAFRTNHMPTLKELSEKCGYREVDYGDKRVQEPLITPVQLGAMETRQALVIISGRTKFISWLPDYTEIFEQGTTNTPKLEWHKRTLNSKVFSLKETVARLIQERKIKTTAENRPSIFPSPSTFTLFENRISPLGVSEQNTCSEPANIDETLKDIDQRLADLNEKEEKEIFVANNRGKHYIELIVCTKECKESDSRKEIVKIANSFRHNKLSSKFDGEFHLYFVDSKKAAEVKNRINGLGATVHAAFHDMN